MDLRRDGKGNEREFRFKDEGCKGRVVEESFNLVKSSRFFYTSCVANCFDSFVIKKRWEVLHFCWMYCCHGGLLFLVEHLCFCQRNAIPALGRSPVKIKLTTSTLLRAPAKSNGGSPCPYWSYLDRLIDQRIGFKFAGTK